MTRYVGLDVHKRFIEVCILDARGKVVFRGKADCRRDALVRFAKERLRRSDRLALEATTNTWPVVDVLQSFVADVVVGNPLKIRLSLRRRSRPTRSTPKCWRSCFVATICLRCGNLTNRRDSCAAGLRIAQH